MFPSDKVVTLGNYQLQYVTTRKPVAKPAAETGDAAKKASASAEAAPHDDKDPSHSHALQLPLVAMGITLGVLLLLNLIVLLRRGPTAPREASPVATPILPAVHPLSSASPGPETKQAAVR